MRPATAWRSSEWKQISAQHKDRTLVMAFEGRFAIGDVDDVVGMVFLHTYAR